MPKTLFDFSELSVNCIHTEDFTNAVKKEEIKLILANFLQIIQFCGENDWEEFQQEVEHCHEVRKDYTKERMGELIGWKNKDIEELKRKRVWQIPISEEARLFGILEKNKPTKNNNLFQALLFDPNHKTYRKSGKNVLASLKDLVCLFSKDDECQEIIVQKASKKRRK